MSAPIFLQYQGEGEFKAPSPHWAREADKEFVVGENYRLAEHHDRSDATHAHYFAVVNETWHSLPDGLMDEYPTAEHLRKKMLVKCSYADERSIVCASKQEARRVAAFIRPMDQYAVVSVREAVVRVYTAQSQSYKAMGSGYSPRAKKRFSTRSPIFSGLTDLQ
ncbi:hypothetical protein LJR235_002926 [Pararhizobium sp. LjRoot235]|uniref:hypothetical protein n=1 Tax=Pararhizobium sp. LjRoot235 TaxID=3342291 RepID=UPI003ECD4EEE